ncbi:cytochrome c biogenesis protein CcdA [Corynebacterium sp. sy017]|uniref:cytochrome c biogenesis CcdA family protein n=1 Tax=unclassified Corynebacterium TaxID=2624378 RepID=UPI001185B985|nr:MULTISPECIES: cytochrome c biogenesis CcdA family protein [unclassified Corynebacterium]MBP3089305.1 cytochrome c biogenesis protein CcdA [Corynebacterium sp. sy017]TSD90995.1 cytochrome c biogenesis protein CcdA [Corynebacterium sp. SY003]
MSGASIGQHFADLVATGPLALGVLAAAAAGLVSFASPCVVPLVPGYISYLAGIVGAEVDYSKDQPTVARAARWRVAGAAALFIAGFSIIFVLATVSVFGAISVLALNSQLLMRIGGVVTILMGLVFMGAIPFLQGEHRIAPRRWSTRLGALLLGGVFALGWTPCLGPTLAAIVSISAGTQGMTAARGVVLVLGYCLGLGIPFLLVALGSAKAMGAVGFLARHSRTIQRIGGVLLIVVGVALLTGAWDIFITWVRQLIERIVDFGVPLI